MLITLRGERADVCLVIRHKLDLTPKRNFLLRVETNLVMYSFGLALQ